MLYNYYILVSQQADTSVRVDAPAGCIQYVLLHKTSMNGTRTWERRAHARRGRHHLIMCFTLTAMANPMSFASMSGANACMLVRVLHTLLTLCACCHAHNSTEGPHPLRQPPAAQPAVSMHMSTGAEQKIVGPTGRPLIGVRVLSLALHGVPCARLRVGTAASRIACTAELA